MSIVKQSFLACISSSTLYIAQGDEFHFLLTHNYRLTTIIKDLAFHVLNRL